ncbi:MAG: glycosyltransferase family 4 protein [Bacteroidales bacterium]
MRVLYYHQYFKTRNAAGGTRSYEFAKRLVKKKHLVTIICARDVDEDLNWKEFHNKDYRIGEVDGIKVIQINLNTSHKQNYIKRTLGFVRFAIKSIRFAFTEQYDILFATSTPLTIGIPGIIIKIFKPKTKFIFEVRDLWPELPRAMGAIRNPIILRLLGLLEKVSYHSANACIGLSPGMVEGIAKKGVHKDNIALIPNACDLELFYPKNVDKNVIKGCSENNFIAIFSGSHGTANGLDFVLDVANYLQKQKNDVIKIVMIGKGVAKNNLVARAKRENLNNCIFLEPVPKNELVEILQASDIGMMVLADIPEFAYGTSPNKFFDYIATGLPVLVNHYGWVSDLISNYKCGYTTDAADYIGYAKKLIYLSNEKKLCDEMGINARKLAEEQFSRETLSDQFIEFLNKFN